MITRPSGETKQSDPTLVVLIALLKLGWRAMRPTQETTQSDPTLVRLIAILTGLESGLVISTDSEGVAAA